MEFYIHNKDDRKLKSAVNLALMFKYDDINYIVYYNTQVEKSNIDIFIGKISYGDQCLVIDKIDSNKQNEFLQIIKDILAFKNPKTEYNDYSNIIETATIVLNNVQKIQIPTSSLETLKNYSGISNKDKKVIDLTPDEEANDSSAEETNEVPVENTNEQVEVVSTVEEYTNEDGIKDDTRVNRLDKLLNEKNEQEIKKKEKQEKKENAKKSAISLPILILLIIAIVVLIIWFFTNYTIEF